MNIEDINASRIVFFGDADQGKSTMMGYIFAESQGINMDDHINELEDELGSGFRMDYCYSSLVNNPNPDSSKQKFRTRSCHFRDFRLPDDQYPLIIMMIDTPGQSESHKNQEYGVAQGDIGIFCVEAKKIVDEEKADEVLRRIKMWLAFHPNRPKRRYIIALTKFDQLNYEEQYYRDCCRKIGKCLDMDDVLAVIPTAVDVYYRKGHNIFSLSEETPWYTGPCLKDAIREQNIDVLNNQNVIPGYAGNDTAVFSIKKEIPVPKSGVGKIWKIIVENGTLGVGDPVKFVNVQLEGSDGSQTCAEAQIKNLRMETTLAVDEDEDEPTSAKKGQSASIDLRLCYSNGDKIFKKNIKANNYTIGFGEKVKYSLYDELFIRFRDDSDVFITRSDKQEVALFYFGKPIPVNIFERTEEGIRVRPVGGRSLAFPDDVVMRGLPIFKNTVVRVSTENDVLEYLPAVFELTRSNIKE